MGDPRAVKPHAGDDARHAARDNARDDARDDARHARDDARDVARDVARDAARHDARHIARHDTRDAARHDARDAARHDARDAARDAECAPQDRAREMPDRMPPKISDDHHQNQLRPTPLVEQVRQPLHTKIQIQS